MRYLSRLTVLLTCTALIFTSCKSKTSKQGKLVPKEATIVIDVNLKAISEQLSWDDIKKTSWFTKALSDTTLPAAVKEMLAHPENNGIDATNDLIFFVMKDGSRDQYYLEGSVSDAGVFEAFNKRLLGVANQMEKDRWQDDTTSLVKTNTFDSTVSKDGELNFLSLGDKGIAGWNKERFVYVFAGPKMGGETPWDMPMPGAETKTESVVPTKDKLKESCKSIFDLKEDNSLYKDEQFAAMVAEEGHIHFYMNAEQMMKGTMQFGMMNMMKLDKFINGNRSTATVNFQNGKISTTSKAYMGKELSDILKKSNSDLNVEMVKMLSGTNVAGVYAMNIRPQTLQELLSLTGMDGFLNLALGQQGITIDDVVKATKGDFIVGVTDLRIKPDTGMLKDGSGDTVIMRDNGPDASFIFACTINDKDAFHKVLKAVERLNNEKGAGKFIYRETDKYFVLGDSKESIDKYLSAKLTDHPFLETMKGNQMGAFADIQTIMNTLQQYNTDTTDKPLFDMNKGMWQNIYMYGGDWNDGGITSKFDINLVDKSTNSLKQMNRFFDQLASHMIAKQEARKKYWDTPPVMDSIPPPPPLVKKKTSKPKQKRK